MKKLLCLLLCLSVLFSATAVFAAAEDFRPPCEEADKNVDYSKDWYLFVEPVFRLKTARALVLNPDGWKKLSEKLTYAENGQIEASDENIEIIWEYWRDTIDKDDPSFVLGDLNRNGRVDVDDARTVMRLSVGLEEYSEKLTPYMADVSLDDKVDVTDARMLIRMAVGLDETGFDMSFNDACLK